VLSWRWCWGGEREGEFGGGWGRNDSFFGAKGGGEKKVFDKVRAEGKEEALEGELNLMTQIKM